MDPSSHFLVVRGQDLALIGVQWRGFLVAQDPDVPLPIQRPILRASENAWISLTFPPQSIAEEKLEGFSPFDGDFGFEFQALPAGPSRIEFQVKAGTPLKVLSAESILQLLASRSLFLPGLSETGEQRAAIEMPWRLFVSLKDRGTGESLVCEHPAQPERSSTGVTGLWRTRMLSRNAVPGDAGLSLVPFDSGEDQPGANTSPLSAGDRRQIVANSAQVFPDATRLELSALGGSLTASAAWMNMEWDHDMALGRDHSVRLSTKGILYPFGHLAEFVEQVERIFSPLLPDPDTPAGPPGSRAVAGLTVERRLIVTEPIRQEDDEVRLRGFPFRRTTILERSFANLADPGNQPFFVPRRLDDEPVEFPIRLTGVDGDVFLKVPMVFVALDTEQEFTGGDLAVTWKPFSDIPLPGVPVNFVPGGGGRPGDVHEVHALVLAGIGQPDHRYRPRITRVKLELPALRSLLPGGESTALLEYAPEFMQQGAGAEVLFRTPAETAIDIDFRKAANRSGGLIVPRLRADSISREFGITVGSVLPGAGRPVDIASVYRDFTLLGFPLTRLIDPDGSAVQNPPKIIPIIRDGRPVGAEMTWTIGKFTRSDPFVPQADPPTIMELNVKSTAEGATTTCTLANFSLSLPMVGAKLLVLRFGSVAFQQLPGKAPNLQIKDLKVDFDGALKLLQEVQTRLQAVLGLEKGPTVLTTPDGIRAGYALDLPDVPAGAFLLRNVQVGVEIDVPFNGRPVSVSLHLATRQDPFNLTILALGGGGYVELVVSGSELARLEISMDFGAFLAVNFLIASGEVYAAGGVRLTKEPSGSFTLGAFIRIGGSIKVLGLVSVAVELLITLTYKSDPDRLSGRAKLVIEVDLTLFSKSVVIDTGEWELIGGVSGVLDEIGGDTSAEDELLQIWRDYREAFAPV